MTSISTLIQAAIDKGYQFDAFTNICSKYSDLTDTYNDGTDTSHFGFTKDGNVWFWFTMQNYPDCNLDIAPISYFDHRYNTINGYTMKSWKTRNKAFALLGLR